MFFKNPFKKPYFTKEFYIVLIIAALILIFSAILLRSSHATKTEILELRVPAGEWDDKIKFTREADNTLVITTDAATVKIKDGTVTVEGSVIIQVGLNIGTASGAGVGDARMSGDLSVGTDQNKVPLQVGSTGLASPMSSTAALFDSEGSITRISIIANNGGQSICQYGDDADEDVGAINYNHSLNRFEFRVLGGTRTTLDSSGNFNNTGSLSPSVGVNVGSATGAGTGDIKASDDIIAADALEGKTLQLTSTQDFPPTAAAAYDGMFWYQEDPSWSNRGVLHFCVRMGISEAYQWKKICVGDDNP